MPNVLKEPISIWRILQDLSVRHQLDLLPEEVTIPNGHIETVGHHLITLKFQIKAKEIRHQISVEVQSSSSKPILSP